MNNRKQEINSILDSLTVRELEDYLKDRKINIEQEELLNKLKIHKEYKGNTTHLQKLCNGVKIGEINELYELGQASVYAYIINYGLHHDFKVKDFIEWIHKMMERDQKMKERIYDIMKDL